jgi:hypothetical protein
LFFLDAFVPENGQSVVEASGRGAQAAIRAALAKGENALASPSAASFNVNEKDRAWVDALATPHPLATFTDASVETGARQRIAKRSYVRATAAGAGFNTVYAKYRSTPGWRTYEVPCGHFVMIDMPDRLTDILLEVA